MAALRGRCHHCQMKNRTSRAYHTLPNRCSSLAPSPLSRVWSSLCGETQSTVPVPDRACLPACVSITWRASKSLFATLSPAAALRLSICLCGFAFSFGLRFCFLRFTFAFKQGQFPLQLLPSAALLSAM